MYTFCGANTPAFRLLSVSGGLKIVTDIKRRHSGMFKPGQSGNPTGRPKSDKTIRELAKEQTEGALQTLIAIATDPMASDAARVQACNSLLDRGWGRPVQMNQNVNVNGGTYYDFLMDIAKKEELDGKTAIEAEPGNDLMA